MRSCSSVMRFISPAPCREFTGKSGNRRSRRNDWRQRPLHRLVSSGLSDDDLELLIVDVGDAVRLLTRMLFRDRERLRFLAPTKTANR